MNCFDSMIWLLIRGFVLPAFIRYFFDKYAALFEIVSSLKDSYLASTSLFRLPECRPRAILTAFFWIASNLASFEDTIIDGMNGAYSITLSIMLSTCLLSPSPGSSVIPRNFGFRSSWMGLLLYSKFIWWLMLNMVLIELILRRHLAWSFFSMNLILWCRLQTLLMSLKSVGPRTLPWETPAWNVWTSESFPSHLTWNERFFYLRNEI